MPLQWNSQATLSWKNVTAGLGCFPFTILAEHVPKTSLQQKSAWSISGDLPESAALQRWSSGDHDQCDHVVQYQCFIDSFTFPCIILPCALYLWIIMILRHHWRLWCRITEVSLYIKCSALRFEIAQALCQAFISNCEFGLANKQGKEKMWLTSQWRLTDSPRGPKLFYWCPIFTWFA